MRNFSLANFGVLASMAIAVGTPSLLLAGAMPQNRINIKHRLLAPLDQNRKPWTLIDSEQPIIYVGSTPREMELQLPMKSRPTLPERLRKMGEVEFERLREKLKLSKIEIEAWPGFDDWGMVTWVVARYRETKTAEWKWFDQSFVKKTRSVLTSSSGPTQILLPTIMDMNREEDKDQIFNNAPDDLYQRPEFENIIWLSQSKQEVFSAWQKFGNEKTVLATCESTPCVPVSLHLPANFNDRPISFVISITKNQITWPEEINWEKEIRSPAKPLLTRRLEIQWPTNFDRLFHHSLQELTGKKPIVSPLSGKKISFLKQSSGQKDNELLDTIAYLGAQHQKMGYELATGKEGRFEYEYQSFTWTGIAQKNLIVKIRGKRHDQPVLMSGHYDKAIAEDTYEKTNGKVRETTPGADDNVTSIATLMNAAKLFRERYSKTPPAQDIYLIHFTGEEFPSGCLGARHYISKELLAKHQDIRANINIDMIGHHTEGDRQFQINPGFGIASWNLAQMAFGVALDLNESSGTAWEPKVRWPWSKQSYLTQTDSAIFDWAGYPTILMNEHINLARKFNPYYHQSNDVAANIDLDYAIIQAKTAIATAALLAEEE